MTLLRSLSSTGKEIKEAEIVKWANAQVKSVGFTSKMDSFKDPTLRTGRFIIDLLASIRRHVVNRDLVTEGETDEDALQNAKYAVSIARKMGATIFVLPEDIVDVKPKMMLTFFGAVMAVANSNPNWKSEAPRRLEKPKAKSAQEDEEYEYEDGDEEEEEEGEAAGGKDEEYDYEYEEE